MDETNKKMYCLIFDKEFHHGVNRTSGWLTRQHTTFGVPGAGVVTSSVPVKPAER